MQIFGILFILSDFQMGCSTIQATKQIKQKLNKFIILITGHIYRNIEMTSCKQKKNHLHIELSDILNLMWYII